MDMAVGELLSNMEHHNIQVLGISEHHIAMANHDTRKKLTETIAPSQRSQVNINFNSSPQYDRSGRMMGGTGLITRAPLIGRINPATQQGDPMGRWSSVQFRRHLQPPLTIISIYQVCQTATNKIGDTAWHQQRQYLDIHQRTEHPRDAFIQDLTKTIQDLQNKKHSIIVGGDWNDWMGSKNSKLLKFVTTLQLIDPWASSNPHMVDFATHEQGQHRIDSIFISPEIYHSVKAIRYTPVGLLCSTDHRGVLIDFHTAMLFGNTIPCPTTTTTPRLVRSKDRKAVTQFIETMHQHLSHHNAFEQGARLDDETINNNELVERLDHLVGEAGTVGEKRCEKRRTTWYSTQLARTRYTVSVLRHYTRGLPVRIDRSNVVRERLQRVEVFIDLPIEVGEAKCLLQEYEDKLQKEREQAESLRRNEFVQHAENAEKAGLSGKARAVRAINKSERNNRSWQILKFMSNKGRTQQLNRLDIPASWPDTTVPINTSMQLEDPKIATEWKTVTEPTEIEHYLMLRNYQHFGQAHGTPFTVAPLDTEINWTGTSPTSEEVLHGAYKNASMRSSLCRGLLKQCRAKVDLDSVPGRITSKEFQGKIKVWDEKTTTSPSGRHLGWYKALYARSIYEENTGASEEFCEKQKDIETLILRIMNYCIREGYPLKRWCHIINTLIFKTPSNYQVHRLRVIHIFEADLNLLYATKWRQLIRFSDNNRLIHEGQYGGRPGYEATSLALLEELRLDISYMTRRTLMTFDNDAASCYNRIVINLASLINRKHGLHRELTELHGTILQDTEYRLKTAAGISQCFYKNSTTRPLYGTGQGAGNSPGIWLLISSTLFETYSNHAHGAEFVSVDQTIRVHTGITGFVDDTNAVVNNYQLQTEPLQSETTAKLHHDAQLWTDLLHVSGGKLELSKCSYHSLQFRFRADGTPQAIPNPNCPELELHDPASNELVRVQFLQPTTAHKILGHWKAPADQHQKAQLQALISKAQEHSLLIAVSPIPRTGARLAYYGKYLASLRYVLPQCWFPQSVLLVAEKKSIHRIISKCGYARTTPSALLYAPPEYAGAGFIHWYTLQGEGQIKHFIKHWRTDTVESKMLRIALSWAQFQAGIGMPILQQVDTPLPHLECRWLQSL